MRTCNVFVTNIDLSRLRFLDESCACVYIHVHTCVCMSTWSHVRVYICHTYITPHLKHTQTHIHIHTYAHIYKLTCIVATITRHTATTRASSMRNQYVCMYVYIYICICVYIYIYVYMYIYIYTHTH